MVTWSASKEENVHKLPSEIKQCLKIKNAAVNSKDHF